MTDLTKIVDDLSKLTVLEAAELDPTHKQLIPYTIFHHAGRYLSYTRGGSSGEKRLVAKRSIGIGGHMNDHDEGLFAFDRAAYDAAVQREVGEELRVEGPRAGGGAVLGGQGGQCGRLCAQPDR